MTATAAERIRRRGIAVSDAEAERASVAAAQVLEQFRGLAGKLRDADDPGLFASLLHEGRPGLRAADHRVGGDAAALAPADIDRTLAEAHRLQRSLNLFIDIFDEEATRRARQVMESRHDAPPLQGVPFAYKDVFATSGRLPTAGVGHGQRWEGKASSAIAALERAGAIAVGATNLDPWCYLPVGINPFFGRVVHPLGDDRVTGGSSSGSAVAVASGLVPFALGTDTGGSVRVPAAICGIFGLKTTHGSLPDRGLIPLSFSQDTIGVLARDPSTIARVLDVLAPSFAASGGAERGAAVRVGVDRGMLADCDDETERAFETAEETARRAGAEIVPIDLPFFAELNSAAGLITASEAASIHAGRLASHPEWYPSSVRARLLLGFLYSGADYADALRLRGAYLRKILDTFGALDAILAPVLPRAEPRLTNQDALDDGTVGRLSLEFLRLNRPVNYLGLPALSFPARKAKDGGSVGMQLIGRPFAELFLLDFAHALTAQSRP